MKIILKNSSLTFQTQAPPTPPEYKTCQYVSANDATGRMAAVSGEGQYDTVGCLDYIPIAKSKVTPVIESSTQAYDILFYDSSQNFLAQGGPSWSYASGSFSQGVVINNILDAQTAFNLDKVEVSRETIEANVAYFRIAFRRSRDSELLNPETNYFGVN